MKLRDVLFWLLCALSVTTGPLVPAAADDWSDARKAFRSATKAEDWKERSEAYDAMAYYDTPDAVEEILRAMVKEENPAVVINGIKTLAGFTSDEARKKLLDELTGGKGTRRNYVLFALVDQEGTDNATTLIDIVEGKDIMLACQAALALGKKQVFGAMPLFIDMLKHKEWQVRAAAARSLELLAGPVPKKPANPKDKMPPWVPEKYDYKQALWPLVDALEASDGSDRRQMISALERLTKQNFGYDLAAWAAYVDGKDPATIKRDPVHPPYFFGVPVFGKRVVILMSTNVRMDNAHPYERERLQALCAVPGGRPVPWYKLRTVQQLMSAFVTRTINDLPKGTKFDFVTVGTHVKPTFGRLKSANSGTKKTAITVIEKLAIEAGNDTYEGYMQVLDISGNKDGVAWDKGPDEIFYVTTAIPWLAEFTDPDVIAAAVGMKARLRMVPIHNVGVGEHPGPMMKAISGHSGGVYVDWER